MCTNVQLFAPVYLLSVATCQVTMHSVSITEWRRRIGAHAPRVPLQRPKSTRYYRQSPKNGGSVLFIVCTVLFSLLLGTLLDTVEEIGCTPLKLSAGTYGRAKVR